MRKITHIERGKEPGNQRQSPAIAAAALRESHRAQSVVIEIIDLTQLIEEAVEANRHRAFERRVRIACCILDDLDVLGNEREIATRLHTMLAAAIDVAVPGTQMECNAIVERTGVVVRVRFMRPASRPVDESAEIVGGEIAACWPRIEDL